MLFYVLIFIALIITVGACVFAYNVFTNPKSHTPKAAAIAALFVAAICLYYSIHRLNDYNDHGTFGTENRDEVEDEDEESPFKDK